MALTLFARYGRRTTFFAVAMGLSLTVAGCSVPGAGGGIHDPYEDGNRKVHEFNRSVDRALLRPVSKGYGKIANDDLQAVVGNVATNLSTPSVMVNNLLQGDIPGFGSNLYRFVINSTVGIAGLFDPAADLGGVQLADADFGGTLAAWGAPEGAYLELPLLGPSTQRDAAGKVVDLFTNPLSYVLVAPERHAGTVARVFDRVGTRDRFGDTIDSVLYESADSYAQTRLIYLQSRRFELGDAASGAYADPYAETVTDPYEDPYAE